MSDTCPVVKIVSNSALGYTLLNEADFDPTVHKLWREVPDHDGDGRKGGSVSQAAVGELDAARADYLTIFGKKPFHGWDAKTLRAKIAGGD